MRSLNPDKLTQLPIWRAIPALLTLLLGWLLLGELAARAPLAYQLPPPSTGADSFEFDLKVFYLEQSLLHDLVGHRSRDAVPGPMAMRLFVFQPIRTQFLIASVPVMAHAAKQYF